LAHDPSLFVRRAFTGGRVHAVRQCILNAGPLRLRVMALLHNLTESLARRMLAREGIAIIWQLHLAATPAHRNGYAGAAASILEIADAAEEAWLREEEERAPNGSPG
jgi:hypothetical protein